MFEQVTERLKAAVPRSERMRTRVSILLPFIIISIGLGGLAIRSYSLSVRMEQGANALAEQDAGAAAELTALYPLRIELQSATTRAWNELHGAHFLVNAVWEIRTKDLLGALR